jgi:hypothetical protein
MKQTSEGMKVSKWANRWILAAIVQGALLVGLTAYLLYQGVYGTPAASRIVAGGGAGTWLTVGYVGYVMLGVLAVAVTALFYRHIELDLGKPYGRLPSLFAWGHLFLMNVGVTVSTWLMMNAGYRGGAAAIPSALGGGGLTQLQIHEQIMAAYPPYIAPFMAVGLVGALAGGLGYVLAWLRPAKAAAEAAVAVGR